MPHSIGMHDTLRTAPHAVWQDFGTSFDNAQLQHHNEAIQQNLMHSDASFDRPQSCGPTLYNHHASSIDTVANMPSFDQCHGIQTGGWQDQQVVVPSQLSPDDELAAYHYTTPDLVDSQFSSSFDSGASGYSGYDTIEPPSPDHAYFAPSDDEMVFVKPEPFNSPTPGSAQWARHSLPYRSSFQIPLSKARKRSTKRRRKTAMPGEAYKTAFPGHSSRRDLIEVRIDPKVSFDNEGKLLPGPNAKKPHVCTKVVDGQQCGRSFERSEHLKRHMSSHSTEKQYPCPLRRFGLCKMAIARPDNACDHFKTHLKTKRKGQRNKDVDWETMEAAILSEYPADKANKLLTNLRKWKQSNPCK
ncbi:hypothetical protein K431DRAFT_299435 [Polychaeton citri CBS 116435]|uniref:C2H2-type domain-containing protein n=1 Tax=Polychaeton citri CBS 116435 TaxID=1314669 RepID=A0A9P4QH44_9PEZI|nr:hypothetical protein K431DRAFT_299435 [Polychaeton citri CBS 116435]